MDDSTNPPLPQDPYAGNGQPAQPPMAAPGTPGAQPHPGVAPQSQPAQPPMAGQPPTTQRPPLRIDHNLLADLGLAALPDEEKKALEKHIYETLEMRVGMRLADQMTNEQLDEFETYFNARDDAGAFRWLETNFPNYKDIVADEFDKLKTEVAGQAPAILAASQQQATAQPQQPATAAEPSQPAMQSPPPANEQSYGSGMPPTPAPPTEAPQWAAPPANQQPPQPPQQTPEQ